MTDVLAILREQAMQKTQGWPEEAFRIRGLWETKLLFRPNALERTFSYTFFVAQTSGQGCSYAAEHAELPREWIGADAREVTLERNALSIAVLDSIFDALPKSPAARFVLEGNSVAKTTQRCRIILDEAARLLAPLEGSRPPSVVNVGVVGNVLAGLTSMGCEVCATDFDPVIVSTNINDVLIEHGSCSYDRVRDSDLAIITGMALATNTLGELLEAAREGGTRILIFAETGAGFGEEYCQTLGVDSVVSEPFPFYIFGGTSLIEIYRRTPGD